MQIEEIIGDMNHIKKKCNNNVNNSDIFQRLTNYIYYRKWSISQSYSIITKIDSHPIKLYFIMKLFLLNLKVY